MITLQELLTDKQILIPINKTENSVEIIARLIKESRLVPKVRQTAEYLIQSIPERNWETEIKTAFNFVTANVRYTRDTYQTEYVQTPLKLLNDIDKRGKAFGDCDDHVVLLGSLLFNIGYKIRLVIMQSVWNKNDSYNHIYLEVKEPKTQRWIALDPTAKDQQFGFEPPSIKKKMFEIF